MRWHRSGTAGFREALARAEARGAAGAEKVSPVVEEILRRVREEGDAALAEYTRRFDRFDPEKKGFAVPRREIDAAWRRVPAALKRSLELAAERIEVFHRRQVEGGFGISLPGATIGQRVLPVARAGVYVPGGKAAYPSTLLMNALPARVAGVPEVIAACSAPGGMVPDIVLAAARIAGLSAVYRIGGAQAIAALAYGTESVPRVDMIAGPGNAYVTEAKRRVFGSVGIDMLAGPSELVVLADRTANPAYVAADLLSQAEHDEDAFVALVTDSRELPPAVERDLARQVRVLPRRGILRESLSRAEGFLTRSLREAVEVVNRLAPEHLSIATRDPWRDLSGIRNAGTAFLGAYSPVAVGDYIAGINHTLPTGGAARFSSPLGVADFFKKINVVSYEFSALRSDAPHVVRLARKEGLVAHAQAVLLRTRGKGKR
ncbi:MAG TPA: histidinol dehydrogenase [Deltaproteobacteria bacterium]|nr:MAG: histidinol dehydrogenase [Deltaproteobacteria bacterium GWA2_65_63]OGP27627.1 MAG: histidinol dehydrogenase [Deltaproteobacteria bacterium GWB2_65_81]OGP39897.1 MAG: histidinol dehydrogenase [Deltaproteobacteria bacterium GWC2_66_88]OGP80025.1 MAG: histidinol dehydrogenase [Deltaproteobacteria bacterium RBG_16_66_15]HAM32100.1 histidinol dehydrogenase [Deltaproteobacteria bacterium]